MNSGSIRYSSTEEKIAAAREFAFRLRRQYTQTHLWIFLTGSAANYQDGPYDKVDIAVISNRMGQEAEDYIRRLLTYISGMILVESGIHIDAKLMFNMPPGTPTTRIVQL